MAIFYEAAKFIGQHFFKNISRDKVFTGFVKKELVLKIQPNEQLAISIASINVMEDAIFKIRGVEGDIKKVFRSAKMVDSYFNDTDMDSEMVMPR